MNWLVIYVLLCVASYAQGRHEKYEGHQLYRVYGLGEEFKSLEARLDILSVTPAASSSSGTLEAVVRLSPEEKLQWLQYFDKRRMSYTKIADNLANIFRNEEIQIQSRRTQAKRSGKTISWDTYYRHYEINKYLDELRASYPNLVTIVNASLSYEGRQIKYVRISSSHFENLQKPVIVIDAMVHAREWITTPVAIYTINQLVVELSDSALTEEIDWIIIPLANPDGYEYSIDENRLWRKTRSRSHEGADKCPGVDLNRNFDYHWGTYADSARPCSLAYEGPSAFSEPEAKVIRSAIISSLPRTALYISLHSYGNLFLYSWGNNGTLPPNGLQLHYTGIRMADAIDSLALDKAKRYTVGNAAIILYETSGTSRDWARAVGVPLTYTVELPGYNFEFDVPEEYLEQIVTETWNGIAEGARYVLSYW